MYLAFLISSLKSGGAERVLSVLVNYLVERGCRISLITLASSDAVPFYSVDCRVELIQLNMTNSKEFSLTMRAKNILGRIACLRNTLRDLNPDVIVSFVDVMNVTTLLAARDLKIPVIVSERTHPEYYKLPKFYRVLRLLIYPQASQVVVQTESAANYFNNLSKVSVVSNFVKVPKIIKNESALIIKNIVSVGRLCPFKGFDTLFKSFANLLKYYPNLLLTVYGEGDERKNLEALINSLDLRNKVYLPGVTKNIHRALLKADLFVFPSYYEGFPNALCEAMAVGLPVVASNCSGNVDVVRDGVDGRLFPIGNIEALTNIALELISDRKQRERIAKNAQGITERFNSERIFGLWDKVLLEAVNKSA